MDNVVSDSPSSAATKPFTVNEELSFEDAWLRVAELLQCAVATSQALYFRYPSVLFLTLLSPYFLTRTSQCHL